MACRRSGRWGFGRAGPELRCGFGLVSDGYQHRRVEGLQDRSLIGPRQGRLLA